MNKLTHIFFILILIVSYDIYGQITPEVIIPGYNDRYSNYVRKLESGDANIDYQDFRFSFIESEQFKVSKNRSEDFDSLKKNMYIQMQQSNYPEIIKITKQMLSIDYTSLIAHKILRQTYKILGDTSNASKYKAIQFGLLNSIVKNGDGKSCASAWQVIQLDEEYFILEMINAQLLKQSTDYKEGHCEKMEVKVDGEKRTYYFETSKLFEGYKKLGLE